MNEGQRPAYRIYERRSIKERIEGEAGGGLTSRKVRGFKNTPEVPSFQLHRSPREEYPKYANLNTQSQINKFVHGISSSYSCRKWRLRIPPAEKLRGSKE